MRCPNCDSPRMYVKDTMMAADGNIYRRRKCADCGTRFRSVETLDDGSEEFKRAYSKAIEVKSPYFRNKNKRGTQNG